MLETVSYIIFPIVCYIALITTYFLVCLEMREKHLRVLEGQDLQVRLNQKKIDQLQNSMEEALKDLERKINSGEIRL